jgi:hypothetical protein
MTFPRVTALAIVALLLTAGSFPVNFSIAAVDTGGVTGIASADMNRDGYPDLIVPIFEGPQFIEILLGPPQAGRYVEKPADTASRAVKVAAGDFDNDGWPDVVVLEQQSIEFFSSTHNGSVVSKGTKEIGGTGKELLAIDLNGDHVPDLALTYCGTAQCELATFINDGTGNFSLAQERDFAAPHNQQALAAADFDRDGHDDLALAVGDTVHILLSQNNGNFISGQSLKIAGNIGEFGLVAGDIDAKRGADLVFQASDACAADCSFQSSAYVFLNDGSGTLVESSHLALGGNAGFVNVLGDISGDNRLDLVHLKPGTALNPGYLRYALNVGNGKFGSLATFTSFPVIGAAQAGLSRDMNLDSRHDISQVSSGDLPATWTFLDTSATVICAPPNSANFAAKMCSPSASTLSSRTFTVRGSGNSPTGVRRVELWIDGKKVYDSPDDQLKRNVTLMAGTHRIVVQAVDRFGATKKVVRYVSVP